jgi:hypothetical protein
MNSSTALLLTVVLATSSLCGAAPETTPKIAHTATQPAPVGPIADLTQRGVSRAFVVARIGLPAAQLAENIWVYWDYTTNVHSVSDGKYDTLIVTFRGDRVSDLKVVNSRPIRNLLARLQTENAGHYTAK